MNKPLLVAPHQLERTLYHPYPPTVVQRETNHSNLAIIPVEGLLLHKYEGLGTSYESIRAQIAEALSSPSVEQIVLEIDSGGGEINGLFDLVDFIVEARKQKSITALVNESALSAAYLIASSANQIIAPRTACVGSIGVMVAHCDQSEAERKLGLRFTEIYAGKHKIDFSPHQALSETAQATLQDQVDETYQLLVQTLARNRNIAESVFRGTEAQIYSSNKALNIQLIDRILSPNQLFEELMMTDETNDVKTEVGLDVVLTQERERVKGVMNLCKASNQTDLAYEMIEKGLSVDDARKILFEKLVTSSADSTINAIGEKQSNNQQLINYMVKGLGV